MEDHGKGFVREAGQRGNWTGGHAGTRGNTWRETMTVGPALPGMAGTLVQLRIPREKVEAHDWIRFPFC